MAIRSGLIMAPTALLLLTCLVAGATSLPSSIGSSSSLRGVDPRILETDHQVVGLALIDTIGKIKIVDIVDGAVINLKDYNLPESPVNVAVQAITAGNVGSVKFQWLGASSYQRVEGNPPFSLCGKSAGYPRSCELLSELNTEYTVTATAYSEGSASSEFKASFTLEYKDADTAPPPTTTIDLSGDSPIFRLIHAPTGDSVMDLYDGAIVDLEELNLAGKEPDFNIVYIEANNLSTAVTRVNFSNKHGEGSPPFSYCGDKGGGLKYNTCNDLNVGVHSISAQALDANGKLVRLMAISFQIVADSAGIINPAPSPPIPAPSSPAPPPVESNPQPPVGSAPPPGGGFSLQAGKWLEVDDNAPLSARHEACFVMVGRKAYLVGGRGELATDIYDPVTRNWSQGAAPPIPLHHMQCVVADGKIWIMSAWTGNYPRETTPDSAYTYDVANDTWDEIPALPERRRRGGAAAVLVGRKIYVSHGNQGGHEVANHAISYGWLDYYNIDTGEWTTDLADAPHPRDHTGGALVNGRICVAGGRRGGTLNWPTVGETDCYDLTTETWSEEAEIPQERGGSSYGTTCDGMLMVAGGEGHGKAYDNVDVFDGSAWTTIASMNRDRHGSSLAIDCNCNQIHVASGAETRGGRFEMTSIETFFIDGVDTPCLA